ncbi:MAG: AEC family transporter, partial [Pseudomonadota bacterium]
RLDLGLVLSCAIRLLAVPAIAYLAALGLGLARTETAIVIIASSVPTASAAYVLAQKMGGDAPLMARIITVQTLLAFLTMPLFLALVL